MEVSCISFSIGQSLYRTNKSARCATGLLLSNAAPKYLSILRSLTGINGSLSCLSAVKSRLSLVLAASFLLKSYVLSQRYKKFTFSLKFQLKYWSFFFVHRSAIKLSFAIHSIKMLLTEKTVRFLANFNQLLLSKDQIVFNFGDGLPTRFEEGWSFKTFKTYQESAELYQAVLEESLFDSKK